MTSEIPLLQKDISMLNEKFDKLSEEVKTNFLEYKEEAKRQQAHREESLRFHADLLEKLEEKFAGKWTEKVLVYVGGIMLTAII